MKLKRILSLICVCALLFGNVVFADNYTSLQEKIAQLSHSLANGSDAKNVSVEAIFLISEYEMLKLLSDKGAALQAVSLKEAADTALKNSDTASASALLKQLQQASDVISGEAAPVSFSDVSEKSWYYNAVLYSVSNGIFKGMSETQFAPNMEITRGMFLTLMGRMYKKNTVKYSKKYIDIPDNAYYADAVNWAKANGVLDFIEGEKFYPDRPITREELVTVLRGCKRLSGENVEYLTLMKSFTDSSKISDWAKSSVEWAMAKNVVSGFEDGSFRPQATATRAQVAQIFYNQK